MKAFRQSLLLEVSNAYPSPFSDRRYRHSPAAAPEAIRSLNIDIPYRSAATAVLCKRNFVRLALILSISDLKFLHGQPSQEYLARAQNTILWANWLAILFSRRSVFAIICLKSTTIKATTFFDFQKNCGGFIGRVYRWRELNEAPYCAKFANIQASLMPPP